MRIVRITVTLAAAAALLSGCGDHHDTKKAPAAPGHGHAGVQTGSRSPRADTDLKFTFYAGKAEVRARLQCGAHFAKGTAVLAGKKAAKACRVVDDLSDLLLADPPKSGCKKVETLPGPQHEVRGTLHGESVGRIFGVQPCRSDERDFYRAQKLWDLATTATKVAPTVQTVDPAAPPADAPVVGDYGRTAPGVARPPQPTLRDPRPDRNQAYPCPRGRAVPYPCFKPVDPATAKKNG